MITGTDAGAAGDAPAPGWESALTRFPARPAAADWPATRATREQVWQLLTSPLFSLDNPSSQGNRTRGLTALLDWLQEQPGDTWQQRWAGSGADAAGRGWSRLSGRWLRGRGENIRWRQGELGIGLRMAISADIIRPSLRWLVAAKGSKSALAGSLARARDAAGFAHLRRLCEESGATGAVTARTLSRAALIVAAKGGCVGDVTAGDVLELLDTEAGIHASPPGDTGVFYRLLRQAGDFDPAAPRTLRELRTTGQRTPEQMIDRYHLTCRPVRDLLVDYLRERQPAVDYITLESLARSLGRDFWQDLERHHPGICTLQLPAGVASSWKQRRRTRTKTVADPATGEKTEVAVPRLNYRECLTRVRAFYLDIAQWAAEDPARWGPWVARCPVSPAEINQRKAARHRKSRIDARTRERLPVLPVLVRSVSQRRKDADALLRAARATLPGQAFSAAGQTLVRSVTRHATSTKVWVDDPAAAAARSDPRRRPRVLVLGHRGSTPRHRHPHRGTAGDHPLQPGAIPAADHRRDRAAAADRPVQDRYRAASGGRPGHGGRAVGDHQPPPQPQPFRRGAPGAGLRLPGTHLAAAGAGAVPAPVRLRAPQDQRGIRPRHARCRIRRRRADRR